MLDILLGLLIALLPVIIAIIFTKRYNMVHGLVCFITSAAAVLLFFYKFDEYLPAEIAGHADHFLVGLKAMIEYFDGLLAKIPGLDTLLEGEYKNWVKLAVYFVIYLVSQIPSSIIRGIRRRAYKRLKRASKKY